MNSARPPELGISLSGLLERSRAVASSLSRRLRAAGLSSRRTGAALGRGFTIAATSNTCAGVDVHIYGYDEDDATGFRDDISGFLAEWGHPYEVGQVTDNMASFGFWSVSLHVEGLGDDVVRCGAQEAATLRARVDHLYALVTDSENPKDPLHGQWLNLETKAAQLRKRATQIDPLPRKKAS